MVNRKIFSNHFNVKQIYSFFTDEQEKQFPSSSSSPSVRHCPSTSITSSNVSDISRSFDELPAQPIRVDYPFNKDRRSFRSQLIDFFSYFFLLNFI